MFFLKAEFITGACLSSSVLIRLDIQTQDDNCDASVALYLFRNLFISDKTLYVEAPLML